MALRTRKETFSRYLNSGLDRTEDREMAHLTGLSERAFRKTRGSRTIDRGVVQVLNEKDENMRHRREHTRKEHRREEPRRREEHKRTEHRRTERKTEHREEGRSSHLTEAHHIAHHKARAMYHHEMHRHLTRGRHKK